MRFPVFWLALAYATGLAAFYEVDDSPRVLFLLAAAALFVGLAALGRGWRRATLISALAGFFFAGGATIGLTAAAVPPTRADRLLEARAGEFDLSEAVRLTGWLRRAPQETLTATVYELELESVEQGGRRYAASGGARLSYFKSGEPGLPPEPVPNLRYGERVEVLARVHAPLNHQNAGSFDWRAYLARRDIFLEGSLASYLLVEKLPGLRGNRLIGWTQALRTRLLQRLEALVPPAFQPDRQAVLRAMLLGDAGFLTPAEKERFRFSGAYHVLVVSGLHVGMIALVLFWLLRRLARPGLGAPSGWSRSISWRGCSTAGCTWRIRSRWPRSPCSSCTRSGSSSPASIFPSAPSFSSPSSPCPGWSAPRSPTARPSASSTPKSATSCCDPRTSPSSGSTSACWPPPWPA